MILGGVLATLIITDLLVKLVLILIIGHGDASVENPGRPCI
jgi:hypothetical protein